MKNNIAQPLRKGAKSICWRTAFSGALLCMCALVSLRADAVYYTTSKSRVKGARTSNGTADRSKIQPTGDPRVVGKHYRDENGNVIVMWPAWLNGAGILFPQETMVLGRYKDEADFMKAYLEKCRARENKPNVRQVLGAEYELKSIHMRAGKRMWAEHLKVLQAALASEKKLLCGLPLESLFGIKIGKPIDVDLHEKSETDNCYEFKPAKQFRRFDSYSFRVTPKSHVVYQITAKADDFAESEGQGKEWDYVKQVFMKKFQKQAVKEIPDNAGYMLLFPDAGSGIGRKIVILRSEGAATITAVDLRLEKLAEVEKLSTDAKRLVPSLKDVDAL